MKVLFAGPSLFGVDWEDIAPDGSGIIRRGPACHGDITRAVVEGASAIGLVDGRFGDVAAVWHKELLYALEQGVHVFGAASMGALRAAECAAFGMIGIGTIFERYRCGDLEDDAAVALLHAPAELDYMPLTEAMVNVEATIHHLLQSGAVTHDLAARLEASARSLFYGDRTCLRILEHSGVAHGRQGKELADLLAQARLDVKQSDALLLVERLASDGSFEQPRPHGWQMEPTYTFIAALKQARSLSAGGDRLESRLNAISGEGQRMFGQGVMAPRPR
jgi:hypothetical protein